MTKINLSCRFLNINFHLKIKLLVTFTIEKFDVLFAKLMIGMAEASRARSESVFLHILIIIKLT